LRQLDLGKIEVLAGSRVLATLEGVELNSSLYRPGAREINDKRDIAGGLRAVAFIDVALSGREAVPASLRHRVTVRNGRTLEGAAVTVLTKPIAIGPPLRGAIWVAGNGPGSPTHGRALIPVAGHAAIAQRFAIDWVQVDASAPETTGTGADNKNYLAYGEEVIAVADATVVAVKDGIAENVPGENSRAVPITLDTVAGNYVMLDLGRQHFALYAHVQPGSLRVKVGDKVRRGQVLGLLGNSGNSTEPHLHFHVTNANSPLGAEGIPYVIDAFEVETMPGVWQTLRNQIPLDGQHVRFK
jgi:murein DD-endopeptidase MepM/ murein hydrolase activator NlpD